MHLLRWLIALFLVSVVCWQFPLFHTINLKQATAERAAAAFNSTEFAETFWTNQMLSSLTKTVEAETLLKAIPDPAAAKTNYAHTVGTGGYFYFLAGTGRVVGVTDDEVLLAVTGGSTNAEVSLQTGLVFGNALRDGTGLLNVNDYPNSQDFNGISEALNHIVETQVLPKLRAQAKVGAKISFAGCVEVDDEASDLKPLKVIPIQTEAR